MIPNVDDAIALTTDDDTDADHVLWHGHLTDNWSIGHVPNGGYTGAVRKVAVGLGSRYRLETTTK